ncbi:hypothetical protein [Leptodesmis sp.]
MQSSWQGRWLKRWSVPVVVLAIAGMAFSVYQAKLWSKTNG